MTGINQFAGNNQRNIELQGRECLEFFLYKKKHPQVLSPHVFGLQAFHHTFLWLE